MKNRKSDDIVILIIMLMVQGMGNRFQCIPFAPNFSRFAAKLLAGCLSLRGKSHIYLTVMHHEPIFGSDLFLRKCKRNSRQVLNESEDKCLTDEPAAECVDVVSNLLTNVSVWVFVCVCVCGGYRARKNGQRPLDNYGHEMFRWVEYY